MARGCFLSLFLAVLAMVPTACARSVSMTADAPLRDARQLVVVTTPGWTSVDGTMRRFSRDSGEAAWREVGVATAIVVGRTGLAWGRGLHPESNDGPTKREGDGKAPAGIFTLGTAFGFGDQASTRLPYLTLDERTECVDDSASRFYNQIVDRKQAIPVDWSSSEKMRGIDQYRMGVVVNHNIPAARGKGSCIFLHLWGGAGTGTVGCTAMASEDLKRLLEWLDPSLRPLVVQLPAGEYARLRNSWSLP
ncbi:MAG TPA: L,D-transpeptidase family protein [Thermoanaerobaculia bacterium]|nr:L,D-transpeptidase family protein [Thermoanaerobaculia bacterium]